MPTLEISIHNHDDSEYAEFMDRIQQRFMDNINGGSESLFTTDAKDLWAIYLDSFNDPDERQYHNCHSCRHFIERFGGLVTINDQGITTSAIWSDVDAPVNYVKAIASLNKTVRRAKVTGVFLSSDKVWGQPVTGQWMHLAVKPPAVILYKRSVLTAGQAMAEKRENFRTVIRALADFSKDHLEMALTLLKTDSLYRSEKVLGQAVWLYDLQSAFTSSKGNRSNIVWKAVATSPSGFCHPKSSMIGTLLEDIAAGKDFSEVSRAFSAKMHPLAYQRPQAAPSSAEISEAEKIIQQLNAAGSLDRRFCRLDEVRALWKPQCSNNEQATGVFGHLKTKSHSPSNIAIPPQVMTWEKFQRTVLPTAEQIEFKAPINGNYAALLTAVNADSPPIIQWDLEESRNPVSWYLWYGGSSAESFGLRGDQFVKVDAITLKPSMWNGDFEHHGAGLIFILSGAQETRQSGNALFPEILKPEFRPIRSVIAAYSKTAKIQGMNEPHAAGVLVDKNKSPWNVTVRVFSNGKSLDYRLDRWD